LIAEDPASPQGKCKLDLGEASGKDSSISLFGRLSLVYGLDPSRHPPKSAQQRAIDDDYRLIEEFGSCNLCRFNGVPDSQGVIRFI